MTRKKQAGGTSRGIDARRDGFCTGNDFRIPGIDVWIAVILSVFMFLLYLMTLAPGIVAEGDGAEFAACVSVNGIPHKPGYPTYLLLCRLFALLPFGNSLIYKMNLLSAVCSAGTAAVLFLVTRFFCKNRFGAVFSTLMFCSGTIVWTQSIIAEVYAPLSLWLSVNFLFLFLWNHTGKAKFLLSSALWIGLGLGIHKTILILIPLFTGYVVLKIRNAVFNRKLMIYCGVLFFLGFSTYFYLPFLAGKKPLINIENPDTVLKIFNQLAFNPFKPSSIKADQDKATHSMREKIKSYAAHWKVQYPLLCTGIGLLGLIMGFRSHENRSGHLLLVAVFLVTSLGFLYRFDFGSTGSKANEYRVMYIPGYLIFSAWIAAGYEGILILIRERASVRYLCSRFFRRFSLDAIVGLFISGLIATAYIPPRMVQVDKSQNHFFYDFGKNIFDSVPQKSILITTGDNTIFPLIYLQMVEKRMPATALIHLPMLQSDWYREMVTGTYSGIIFDDGSTNLRTFVRTNIKNYPIYIDLSFNVPPDDPEFSSIPTGLVQRLIQKKNPRPEVHHFVPKHLRGINDPLISKDLREKTIINSYPLAQYHLGTEFLNQARYQEAVNAYRLGLSYSQMDFAPNRHVRKLLHLNSGVAFFYQKRFKDARREWTYALNIDPNDGNIQKNMQILEKAVRQSQ